jgi:hypothetical protein
VRLYVKNPFDRFEVVIIQTARHARSAAEQVLYVNINAISRRSQRYLIAVKAIEIKIRIAIKLRPQFRMPRIVATAIIFFSIQ